jgi:hypothetical protein
MAVARVRFDGTSESLSKELKNFLTSPGCIAYAEKLSGPLDSDALQKHALMLKALQSLQNNLSFTKKAMHKALIQAVDEKWGLDKKEMKAWAATVGDRIRCMCRHVYVASKKKKHPAWLASVLGDPVDEAAEEGEGGSEEGGEEETPEHDEVCIEEEIKADDDMDSYTFGWDAGLGRAWRQKGKSKKKANDYTELVEPGKTKFMMAKFADNMTKELTMLTITDYDMWKKAGEDGTAAQAAKTKTWLWSGQHIASGLPVTIGLRHDRQLLMSVFWGPNQVLQAPVMRFQCQDNCLSILSEIAGQFCNGSLNKDELYKKRDELTEAKYQINLKARGGGACKRPAAAMEEKVENDAKAPAKAPKDEAKAPVPKKAKAPKDEDKAPATASKSSEPLGIPMSPFESVAFLFGDGSST